MNARPFVKPGEKPPEKPPVMPIWAATGIPPRHPGPRSKPRPLVSVSSRLRGTDNEAGSNPDLFYWKRGRAVLRAPVAGPTKTGIP